MTTPQEFYSPSEEPTRREHDAMWRRISGGFAPSERQHLLTFERRSFLFGMAATLVLMFAVVGVYTTVNTAIEKAQPAAVQIDNAYRSAIDEFEKVAVRYDRPGASDLATSRQNQLQLLESAIGSLRSETNSHDISPMMRSRLRELYSKKLALLQVMVEQGDIEL